MGEDKDFFKCYIITRSNNQSSDQLPTGLLGNMTLKDARKKATEYVLRNPNVVLTISKIYSDILLVATVKENNRDV